MKTEQATTVELCGVPGTLERIAGTGELWAKQVWTSELGEFTDTHGDRCRIRVKVRYDDECGNGHNTFTITGYGKVIGQRGGDFGGCCHGDIANAFPELKHLIPWHLCNSDGPMYYVSNTLHHVSTGYHVGRIWIEKPRNLDYARDTAVWPEATDEELLAPDLKEKLLARLPDLLQRFKATVKAAGLLYTPE